MRCEVGVGLGVGGAVVGVGVEASSVERRHALDIGWWARQWHIVPLHSARVARNHLIR